MWSISDPCLNCPIQMPPDKVSHFSFHWSIAPLLWRTSGTVRLNSCPSGYLIKQLLRSLGQKVFVGGVKMLKSSLKW